MRTVTSKTILALALLVACLGLDRTSLAVVSAQGSYGGNSAGWLRPTSTFSGAVIDTSGEPVPGVAITLFWTNFNTAQTTTTDAGGFYTFANVSASSPYGSYEISAAKPGFGFLASSANPNATVIKSDHWALFRTVIALPSNVPLQVYDANFIAMTAGEKLVDLRQTGQTISYAVGDDAMVARGVHWPQPRFTDNGDGTATDNLTGLIWLKDAGCLRQRNWFEALEAASQLADGSCGLADGSSPGEWRLPNVGELESLVDSSTSKPAVSEGNPFEGIVDTYWSSTTYRGVPFNAWVIRFSDGRYINDSVGNVKAASANAAWPVKSRKRNGALTLSATGQFIIYAAGDDASVLSGVRMTYPRFIDNGDGTIADTVTGLIWMKKADCIRSDWWNAAAAINNLADGQCGLSDGSTAGQWRMPNRAELLSLGDRAETNQALRFNTVFHNADGSIDQPAVFEAFPNGDFLWTSTTYSGSAIFAWTVYSCDFGVYDIPKTNAGYSLALRDPFPKDEQ